MHRIIASVATLAVSLTLRSAIDVGPIIVNLPQSGCALTATETVQVQLFNYGEHLPVFPNPLQAVPVSFSVDGGPAVTEVPLYTSWDSLETKIHTFTVTADLSAPGPHVIQIITSVVGDGNATNDTLTVIVNNFPPSDGGDIEPDTTVCGGTNFGTLIASGVIGTVLQWEQSTDGGFNWIVIANTDTFLNFSNLTVTTMYRLLAQSGVCVADYSDTATVTVDPPPVAGTLEMDQIVCSGDNAVILELNGYSGTIVKWQSNSGAGWVDVANTDDTMHVDDLTVTTSYRVLVGSGVCVPDTSNIVTLTVAPNPIGGTIMSSATVCGGNNHDTLVLVGSLGQIPRWEFSIDGGFNWVSINNTDTFLVYNNLTTTTKYRVVVEVFGCPPTFSDTATVTVDPQPEAGLLQEDKFECGASNSDTLELLLYQGTIIKWQKDDGGGWVDIANTDDTLVYFNLPVTTDFRVVVGSGVCPADTSNTVTVTVSPATVAGTLLADATVCGGMNHDTLTLSGHIGTVQQWESSVDGGFNWVPIVNTTSSLVYHNITQTTMYRVQVQSGGCPPAYSNTVTIVVDQPPVGGEVVQSQFVCSGSNSDTLRLINYSGTIVKWQMNNGSGWTDIANTNDYYVFTNLTVTTRYRVIVARGVCPYDTSAVAMITVIPTTVGGTVMSSAAVCAGSNHDTLKLVGHAGNVKQWEYSTDGGFNWVPIINSNDELIYNNLTVTTKYRVLVGAQGCPDVYSSVATITVDPVSDAGTLGTSATVCSGNNGDTLRLTDYVGSIVKWQSNSGSGWVDIANTNDFYIYTNLTVTTYFRVIVQSGVCAPDTSNVVTITVITGTVGGQVVADATVCAGMNHDTLRLINHVGDVERWETSTDGGFTWVAIANNDTFQIYHNLTVTTMYRALITAQGCPDQHSSAATITVDPQSDAGTTSGDVLICDSINSGVISITGYSGSVVTWEKNTGSGWTTVSNTDDTLHYQNVLQNTDYRVIVQSGSCPPDTSDVVTLTANITVALFSAADVCFGDTVHFVNTSVVLNGSIVLNDWNFGDGNSSTAVSPSHLYSNPNTYSVSLAVESNLGCRDSLTQDVDVFQLPTLDAEPDTTIALGQAVQLSTVISASPPYTIVWSPGTGLSNVSVPDPVATPVITTTYTAQVVDVNGCRAQDSVEVIVLPDLQLVVANLVTRNDDGKNDTWYIGNILQYPDCEVIVVNSSGQEVFRTTAYDNTWDGHVDGRYLPDDTYYYVIICDGYETIYKGHVTFIGNK